jgi:tRNA(Ile)-lysidine synthase
LLHPGLVVVAVSGGPDSVALLQLLVSLQAQYRIVLHVLHVHHGLRGPEADGDAVFVEALAHELRLPCTVERVVPRAGRAGTSEAAARESRYTAFERACVRLGSDTVALGHTRDDQVETVLMWMLRGTGAQGLQGIPVVRSCGSYRVVRPLLSTWRDDVHAWLDAQGRRARADGSNSDVRFMRNKIRHELLPQLAAEYNPQVKQALLQLAEMVADEHLCVEQLAEVFLMEQATASAHASVAIARLCAEPVAVQRTVFRTLVERLIGHTQQLTFQHWREVAELLTERPEGAIVDLPHGVQAQKRSGRLELRHRTGQTACSAALDSV